MTVLMTQYLQPKSVHWDSRLCEFCLEIHVSFSCEIIYNNQTSIIYKYDTLNWRLKTMALFKTSVKSGVHMFSKCVPCDFTHIIYVDVYLLQIQIQCCQPTATYTSLWIESKHVFICIPLNIYHIENILNINCRY